MSNTSDDMKDDYSAEFAAAIANGTAVRGKYLARFNRMVQLDEDVFSAFPTATDVNAALRSVIEASKHVRRS
jgi:uncharacterized protein (DUF4415 family)